MIFTWHRFVYLWPMGIRHFCFYKTQDASYSDDDSCVWRPDRNYGVDKCNWNWRIGFLFSSSPFPFSFLTFVCFLYNLQLNAFETDQIKESSRKQDHYSLRNWDTLYDNESGDRTQIIHEQISRARLWINRTEGSNKTKTGTHTVENL